MPSFVLAIHLYIGSDEGARGAAPEAFRDSRNTGSRPESPDRGICCPLLGSLRISCKDAEMHSREMTR